ncbi:hypothetical protein [Planomonospora venezuelensis]|uniref:Uncharacterized protein n=1 Tax=Planomonospora venezuelensis TaxID=1999 RepID=A0A841D6M5_PLAVE|nr:hypothetical protein [Planomonospora venezuelensis]MBB5965129.1 hypothetical protein [Planomonospora venezuelensis]GIN00406.1 hypothetical protein Pve01_20640 [Planomonospora venezuelensis]
MSAGRGTARPGRAAESAARGPGSRRAAAWFRAGLAYLAVAELAVGAWALASPSGFYEDFPLPGRRWVATLPPYNEHLLLDFGGLNLGFGMMLAVAAVTPERLLVRTVLAGYLAYAVPHLAFHLGHLRHFAMVDVVGQVVTLSIAVVVPLALLSWDLAKNRKTGLFLRHGSEG